MKVSLPTIPNFPELELKWLKHWYQTGVVAKYLQKNAASPKRFSFFDGPITANNPMGVHHGWGRTYKDLWQKFYNLLGYRQRFQNGFDCQGLWVEVEVEKELGLKNKKDIENLVPGNPHASIAKFVELCKKRVLKYSAIQTKQSQRLGYFMDWDNSYFTMSDANNYMIWHFLKVCHDNGWIYKGRESVPWCPRCETAISQHEMLTEDYQETEHESIYLELPLENRPHEYFLVWTTTPWTIPANIAVAVDVKLDYALVKGISGDLFWIAAEAVTRIFKKSSQKILKTVKGKELVGWQYRTPFDELAIVKQTAAESPDTFHRIIATDPLILPVSTTEGTGLVHTAVSAGVEDFKLGKLRGLPMIPVIADNADYLPHMGFLAGKNAKKHPEIILDYLRQKEAKEGIWVFEIENYKHRYPACWRCKTELVWKVADEWYIAMDKVGKHGKTLRSMMVETAKKIKWLPSFGLDRELDWLENMHDWLISKKNRYWGLALPIYECGQCGHFQVIGSREELQKSAASGWEKFDGHTPHKPWIDMVEIKCEKCQSLVKRISDVGNPWLDAGIIPYSTLVDPQTKKVSYLSNKKYWQQWFPADFITESFPGQFKNWFYSLIAMSTVLEQTPPFKTVLGYATCLGEDSRPMHKSWGNAIAFDEGAAKIGVDVMRWMYAKQDPKKNLLFGYNIASEVKRSFHIPLWNILKFYLTYAILDKYANKIEPDLDVLSLSVLDRWLLARLAETISKVKLHLSRFKPNLAAHAIEELVLDASQWYIRLSRSRVWQNNQDQNDKLAFYSTLFYFLKNLSVVLSIFLPFFGEEIYSYLTNIKHNSVHLETWPEMPSSFRNQDLIKDMIKIRAMAEQGHVERKSKQIKVRQPLSKIVFKLNADDYPTLEQNHKHYRKLLEQELNLKQVVFQKAKTTSAQLDTKLTEILIWEGKVRDYIRQIQKLRQVANCRIDEKINVRMPNVPQKYRELIKTKVLANRIDIESSQEVKITKIEQ